MICVGSGHVVDCKGVSICWDKAMDNEVSFAASLHVCPMVLRDASARFLTSAVVWSLLSSVGPWQQLYVICSTDFGRLLGLHLCKSMHDHCQL